MTGAKVMPKPANKKPKTPKPVDNQKTTKTAVSEPIEKKPEGAEKESRKKTKRQYAEAYLKQRFRFRFNELTGGIEYSPAARDEFKELNDYWLNSLCRDIDAERGLGIPAGTLIGYLKSDFVSNFHPLREYFLNLPRRSGTEALHQLAETVTVKKPDLFRLALTRWMVATIANVFTDRDCQNQTCLVLTGEQGTFKTTWLNLLCPASLERYRFTGKIDLQSKDTLIMLATQFIINLDDQLRELNKRDGETVKTLISHGNVTVRRPYDKIASFLTRTASFCGSINGEDFLTDPTGSRRFLPFEVSAIDIQQAQKLNPDDAWAEAYALYKSGYQYWFTATETDEMFANNEDFQVATPEYELLHEYYEVVDKDEWASVKLTATQLLNALQQHSRVPLGTKRLGEALKKSKAIKKTSRKAGHGKVYFLRERSDREREEQREAHTRQEEPMTVDAF